MTLFLRREGHNAWSAYEAGLAEATDRELIVYAEDKEAIAVTTNRDFATLARRMRAARVVHLRVKEVSAVDAMRRASDWLGANHLPNGRVLRVPLTGKIEILPPLSQRR